MTALFDLGTMTLGELADFEEVTGRDPMNLPDAWRPTVRDMVAIAWIVGRRRDPAFTLEDARNLRPEDLVDMVPTEAAPAAQSEVDSSTGSPSSRASTGSARRTSGR